MNCKPDIKNSTSGAVNDIQFIDVFNLEDIQYLQDLFSDTSGVASIITHPDGTPITRPSNFCRLCNDIIRKTEKGRANCYHSDAIIGRYNPSGAIIWPCLSGGLWDAGASITVGGKHIANWLIGQVRNEALDEQRMVEYADEIGADRDDFRKALNEVSIMSLEQFNNVAKMLFAFASELSEKTYNNLQLKMQIAEQKKATAALLESEQRFQLLFNKAPLGYQSLDIEGNFIEVNQQWLDTLGYTRLEVIGKWFGDFLSPAYQDGFLKRFPIFKSEGKIHSEFEMVHKNGNRLFIAFEGRICYDLDGEFKQMHCILQDITERKRLEESLEESKKTAERYLNVVAEIILSMDTLGNITLLNDSGHHLLGYNRGELIGKNWFKTCLPHEMISEVSGVIEKLMNGDIENVVNNENVVKTKSGEIRTILWHNTLLKDLDGNITGLISSGEDITESKQAEERLREQTDAMEAATDGMALLNADQKYIYMNKSYAAIYGYDNASELIGSSWRVHYFTEELQRFEKEFVPKIRLNGHFQGRFLGKKKDGTTFPQELSLAVLENGNGICIVRDITDLKQAEQELIIAKNKAEESDKLKSAFLANMSHEIRTPMNGILGFADLLKEKELTVEERQEYINIIEKSGLHMLNIINDLIDISKVESGQMEIYISETNVNDQIKDICTFFKPEVERKGMQIFIQNSLPPEETVIRTDREKLYAILTNLVKNAIKYSDKGTIEFGYSLKAASPAELVFFVKDTGIGISQDQKKAIFDRFVQVDLTNKRVVQGAGLGLAISKAYVKMLGGTIWVESEEGKGSTFYFTIPYNTEPE